MTLTRITSDGITDAAIVNADINASAAIAGSKISPDFGSQDIVTAGNITTDGGFLGINGTGPQLRLNDTDSENDFEIQNSNGSFVVRDIDANSNRLTIASDGTTTIAGNTDFGAGIDVTGNITATGHVALPDNSQLRLGTVDDLKIYHDGTDSHIDNNTSNLRIKSNDIQLRDNAQNFYVDCNNGGSVDLYHNGTKKFSTTSSGATVTGTFVVDATTGLGLPIGTDANEPSASSSKGYIRFNDDDDAVYFSDGSDWIKMTATIPVLSSVSGNIFVSSATTLTLAGSGFMSSGLVVNFSQSSDSIDADVTVTPSSDTAATVAVPAAVYNNVTAGNAVTIKVTNSDNKASGGVNKTAVALPSGGSISTSGSFRIHTFTSSGTFVNTIASNSVEYLVVAGGAGGGNTVAFGVSGSSGGGAGGYRSSASGESSGGGASAESALTLSAASYTVTVGGGGSGTSSHATGSNGSNSVFGSITSIGGGGGGGGSGTAGNGGSGGGKAYSGGVGTGTAGQGFDGGNHGERGGGGGGGAGAVGQSRDGSVQNGGQGGTGVSSSINGSATTRAGGGGASGSSSGSGGPGGSGGGGNGTGNSGTGGSGSGNTGGGGGGTGPGGGTSGSGGSGIVIVRYTL